MAGFGVVAFVVAVAPGESGLVGGCGELPEDSVCPFLMLSCGGGVEEREEGLVESFLVVVNSVVVVGASVKLWDYGG